MLDFAGGGGRIRPTLLPFKNCQSVPNHLKKRNLSICAFLFLVVCYSEASAFPRIPFNLSSDTLCTIGAYFTGCWDTDPNNDPAVMGKVCYKQSGKISEEPDKCKTDGGNSKAYVLEQTCNGEKLGFLKAQECSFGCDQGACEKAVCTDSDEKEKNPLLVGGTVEVGSKKQPAKIKKSDVCFPNAPNMIGEQVCNADHTAWMPTGQPCPTGSTCTLDGQGVAFCQKPTVTTWCMDLNNPVDLSNSAGLVFGVGNNPPKTLNNKCLSDPDMQPLLSAYAGFADKKEQTVLDMTCLDLNKDGQPDFPGVPQAVLCPDNQICQGGKCINNPVNKVCEDTEQQALATGQAKSINDPDFVGSVTISVDGVKMAAQPDQCQGDTILDYKCNAKATDILLPPTEIDCAALGKACQNGKCVKAGCGTTSKVNLIYQTPAESEVIEAPGDSSLFLPSAQGIKYLSTTNPYLYDVNKDGKQDLIWGYSGYQNLWYGAGDETKFSGSPPQLFVPSITLDDGKLSTDLEIRGVKDYNLSAGPGLLVNFFNKTPSYIGNYFWSLPPGNSTFAAFDPAQGKKVTSPANYDSPYESDLNSDQLPDLLRYFKNGTNPPYLDIYFNSGGENPWPSKPSQAVSLVALQKQSGWQQSSFPSFAADYFTDAAARDIILQFTKFGVSSKGEKNKLILVIIPHGGPNQFLTPQVLAEIPSTSSEAVMVSADFNKDGLSDLVLFTEDCKDDSNCPVGNLNSDQVGVKFYLWLSDKAGGKTITSAVPTGKKLPPLGSSNAHYILSPVVTDVNADGWIDMALPLRWIDASTGGWTCGVGFLLADTGTGAFEKPTLQILPFTDAGLKGDLLNGTCYVQFATLNDDACPDLVVHHQISNQSLNSDEPVLRIFRSKKP